MRGIDRALLWLDRGYGEGKFAATGSDGEGNTRARARAISVWAPQCYRAHSDFLPLALEGAVREWELQ